MFPKISLFFLRMGILFSCIQVVCAQNSDSVCLNFDQPPLFSSCADPLAGLESQRRCSEEKLFNFLKTELRYPERALAQGIEGLALVKLIIDEEGKVIYTELAQDPGAGCGTEALRICRLLPPFQPAYKGKQAVKVKLNLPIRFKIERHLHPLDQEKLRLEWGNLAWDTLSYKQMRKSQRLQRFQVRDQDGKSYLIEKISLTYIHKRRVRTVDLLGSQLDDKAQKWLRRARKNSFVVVTAVVQDGDGLSEVLREWTLVKE